MPAQSLQISPSLVTLMPNITTLATNGPRLATKCAVRAHRDAVAPARSR